jgi:signal transduction histidine kinase/DNA-binding beta-propeller fold protein YncE/chitodextrinase
MRRRGSFRKLARYSACMALVMGLAGLNIALLHTAKAFTQYAASDNLGQRDIGANTPHYDWNVFNNVPENNATGYHFPRGVALDGANHRLYIADSSNARVMEYDLDSSNHFTGTSASHVLGEPDFTTFKGKDNHFHSCTTLGPRQNDFCTPIGIFYDSANQRLFVSDEDFGRILVFDTSGGITDGMNANRVIGQPNFTTAPYRSTSCFLGQTPSASNFCGVNGVNYDSGSQKLYAADSQYNRVLMFDLSGGISNGMAASNVLGQLAFNTKSGSTTQSTFSRPAAVLYDSAGQRLFVGDSSNQRDMVFDLSGGLSDGMNASHVLGKANFTSSTTCSPVSATCHGAGQGLSYDATNHRLFGSAFGGIYVTDITGGISDGMAAAHIIGAPTFTGSTGDASQSILGTGGPTYYDSVSQQLYAADAGFERVLSFDLSGGISDGMNANQVEGQTDYTGAPSYTTSEEQNQNPGPYGFDAPSDSQIDPVHHRMYVVDQVNSRVLIFNLNNSNQVIDHTADFVLGQPDFSTNTPACDIPDATQSSLCVPTQVAVDSVHDRIFVTEIFASRVMVFDFSGGISNGMNASQELGQVDFSGNPNICDNTSAHEMCDADGAVYDAANERLFVSDSSYSRILVFDVDPATITSGEDAIHVLGASDFTSEGNGSQAATDVWDPQGLAYDSVNKYLFVADYGNGRITVFDLSSGISDGMAASWVLGQAGFGSGLCLHNQTTICTAYGISYDQTTKRLFADEPNANRVLEWDLWNGISNGMPANDVIGQPNFTLHNFGVSQTALDTPMGITYDGANGKLYVSDYFNNRVQTFDVGLTITTNSLPPGMLSTAYSSTVEIQEAAGSPTFSISSGSLPPGLSIDSSTGEISGTPTLEGTYNFTVQVTDEAGEVATKALSIYVGHPYAASDLLGQVDGSDAPIWNQRANDNNAGSTNAQGLDYPTGTAMDPVRHRLFIVDESNSRVLVFNLDNNNNLIDHTADLVLGQPDMTSGFGSFTNCPWNGGTAAADNMCQPVGVSFDEANNRLFVPDIGDNRVLVFNLASGISDGMAASHVLGQPDFSSSNALTTQDGMSDPVGGLAYEPSTKFLYVSDSQNGRVVVYDTDPATITDGENAGFVIGQPDFTTSNYPNVTQDGLGFPDALTLDTVNHRLFVGDWSSGGRVVVFDTNSLSNGMAASHVLGETDFTSSNSASDNGDPPDAKSFGPTGLAFDSKHNLLFVSDDNDSRILIFDTSAIIDNEDAVGVLGQLGFTDVSSSCVTSQTTLCDPEGYSEYYDTTNNRLYVADSGNNRVMVYDFARLIGPAADGTQGTVYNFATKAHSQGTTSFNLSAGTLPGGLSLDTSSGVISGTPNTAGAFSFTVHMADDNGTPGTFVDDSNYSITINSSGGDSTPPSAPGGLNVSGTTTSSISLAWTASSDNVAVQGYNIYRDGGGTPIASTAGTSFTDSGLGAGATHTYTVTAYDAASNESGHSGLVSGTTQTSGGGGSSGGSSGSGGSTASPKPAPKPPAAPAQPAPGNIDLDSQSGYTGGSGYTKDSESGQTFSFTDSDGGSHTIVVQQVADGSTDLLVDSTPVKLNVGDTSKQDVDGDGHDDISITLNRTDGGKANLTFKKIILALAPGGQTASGFGAGNSQPPAKTKHTEPLIFKLLFPWLLFILLGLSALRLAIQSWKEWRLAGQLTRQLAAEKALIDEKNNFVALSQHYLRTPMAAIANGIELMAAIGGPQAADSQLKALSDELGKGVNDLLSKAGRLPSQTQPTAPGVILPGRSLATAAGFVTISSLPAMLFSLSGTFVIVAVVDYILNHNDIYNVSWINLLSQLAGMLLIAIFFWAARRSHRKNKELRQRNQRLLEQERELDLARNVLVRNAQTNLKAPLAALKNQLAASGADPKIAKPALEGIRQLEGLMGKFTIFASLEAQTMQTRRQPLDVNQLAAQTAARYSQVLQDKGLKVDNQIQSIQLNNDPLLLGFVLDSFLNNAIKYSPNGAEIRLSSSRGRHGLEISVQDQGPGIEADKLSQLFQPFSRAENAARDFNVEGAGLSLYLDKLITRYLGGDIGLDSTPGRGTKAILTL